jgi:hypothetical protein
MTVIHQNTKKKLLYLKPFLHQEKQKSEEEKNN